ncbi:MULTISPECIES: hypothetical protein [unclassified Micromonospora]|uniref:hypothetical protein n=1 Tax=unclassified Micromonospora TaxID=2617518 RepID=UPI001C2227C1|nr:MULTISPECIES: hypothetical protein [unclassified Micromonospora]MBU8855978.1 hypothetical protein [Micromonospora sp. WMMB482]MDM4781584.1 hypothetical protein [Micromonospora sp. b486]
MSRENSGIIVARRAASVGAARRVGHGQGSPQRSQRQAGPHARWPVSGSTTR